jgi:protein transport protein SEC31
VPVACADLGYIQAPSHERKATAFATYTNMHVSSSLQSIKDILRTKSCVVAVLQGRLGAALRYLEMVPGEASTSVAVLKDRIYRWGRQGHQ